MVRLNFTRVVASAAFASAVLLVGACGGDSATEPTTPDEVVEPGVDAAQEPVPIRIITYRGSLFSLQFDVAEEKDLLTKHGLDATVISGQDGPTSTTALISGGVDVILSSLDVSLMGRDAGLDLVAFATIGTSTQALIVNESVPTPNLDKGYPEAIADLKGLTLGVGALGSGTDANLRFLLRKAGLDPDTDVTILPVGFASTALPALQQGRIDGYQATEPVITRTTAEGSAKIVVDLRYGDVPDLYWDFGQWTTTRRVFEEKNEAITRFRAAIVEATEWMQDPANREEVEAIVRERIAAGDAELAKMLLDANLETFKTDLDPASVTKASDVFLEGGIIRNATTPEEYLALD